MTLSAAIHGGVSAIGYDSATNERGFLLKVTNRTGASSVKGLLVSASTTTDREAIKQANEFDCFGIIQEAGVAEGSEMWIWMNGSICQVMFKDGVTPARGEVAMCADTDGRADRFANPGSGLPAIETHFKEIGHLLESKSSGTDVLALVCLHFN
jgi:hypothetical protein